MLAMHLLSWQKSTKDPQLCYLDWIQVCTPNLICNFCSPPSQPSFSIYRQVTHKNILQQSHHVASHMTLPATIPQLSPLNLCRLVERLRWFSWLLTFIYIRLLWLLTRLCVLHLSLFFKCQWPPQWRYQQRLHTHGLVPAQATIPSHPTGISSQGLAPRAASSF